MIYRNFLKPILFRFNPETVHKIFVSVGVFLGSCAIMRWIVKLIYGYSPSTLKKVVDGIEYRTPIILSAGFDYNAQLTRILPSLGFGGVEVGSVTARPCLGNPSPTLTRLPKTRGIIVNKGLKNEGVDAIINRLKKTPREKNFVVGVSIAKTNDQQSANTEEAIKDYLYSFKRLNEENIGDYYTINISCPNAYGGEMFTTPELLNSLLLKIKTVQCSKPIYIKMPINLPWEEIEKLLEVIISYKINGVIFGNLNKNYKDITCEEERPESYRGGISGKPCFSLSNNLIQKTKQFYGDKLTIIGCGGTMSVEDALQKFELGSKLIHMITGMIYEGPSLIKKICKAYALVLKSK